MGGSDGDGGGVGVGVGGVDMGLQDRGMLFLVFGGFWGDCRSYLIFRMAPEGRRSMVKYLFFFLALAHMVYQQLEEIWTRRAKVSQRDDG